MAATEVDLASAYDEVYEAPGQPRPPYRELVDALGQLGAAEVGGRFSQLARTFTERGVTFAHDGEERPFPLDLIPRIIAAAEWDGVAAGVRQRVLALEAFLADVYGPGRCFDDAVVPRSLVATSRHFRREAWGVSPEGQARIVVAGVDLVRDETGRFRVLEDNVRVPSGVSYVIENRRAMTQAFAPFFARYRVHPVDDYPARLLAALRASAPDTVRDPTVVVLTPGVHNAAYFEHVLLARLMGVELVEGGDLVVRANELMMKTTEGERPVHVVYRRVDDEYLDPLQFRPDSVLGVAGLVNAARARKVTIANALGNGVADDKLLYTYVPDLIRYYRHEEPLLDNVETFRLEDPEVRAEVLAHLDRYVVKPVDGSGGKGIVIGPRASAEELEELGLALAENPRGWVAQRPVALSTAPTLVAGELVPRHLDLRPFAVHDGREVWVLPGGLTRVALPEGELVVNSSQGGGSKDTWVLAEGPEPGPASAEALPPLAAPHEQPRQVGPPVDEGVDQ